MHDATPQPEAQAMATMPHHGIFFIILVLDAAQSCSAFLSYAAVRSNAAGSNVRRGGNINMEAKPTWRGLLDGVMGRTDAQKKGSGSAVLTPKSRVKLGDLSVSPMGELVGL